MRTSSSQWKGDLERVLGPGRVSLRVPLAPFTTFKIGGPADLFFSARTPEELTLAMAVARDRGIPWFLLGRGANILVSDRGFRGLVLKSELGRVEFPDPLRVRAEAGVDVYPDLIRKTVDRGLGGLHHFAGIPSSVGGALWQNLHFLSPSPARERTVFIEEVLESAEILNEAGARVQVRGDYFEFAYDSSILHDRDDIVLSATFRLAPQPPEELEEVIRQNLAWRSKRHPDLRRLPSAGSIFKKVKGIGAGRLIDECGLKGVRSGGAQIFPGHANFIVNTGGATAADVLKLLTLARDTVLRETGHQLEPEISLVGEF
jgi:UDP-N-acetylmuramate dehydrogenase